MNALFDGERPFSLSTLIEMALLTNAAVWFKIRA